MVWLYSITILLGSFLLFLVQPMCAKMLLPLLGGTPAAWNTCMVFFQAGLLVGYAYAHAGPKWLGIRPHADLHLALLAAAFFLLPIQLSDEAPEGVHPIAWQLLALTCSVGTPFVLLSAGAPLLQRWFVKVSNDDPYFLYAASNVGSFLGLGAFPVLLEPYLSLSAMNSGWTYVYIVCAVLVAACVPWRASPLGQTAPMEPTSTPSPTWRHRGRWIMLALIPSSLLLSVTTHLTTDIAAIPLLWLIPMAIYLVTFTLVFARGRPLTPGPSPPEGRGEKGIIPHALFVRWLPLVVIVMIVVLVLEATQPLLVVMAIHLGGFFWLAMTCHGALARSRPAAAHLTDFYLCLAVGGVLGGALNALVAPMLFSSLLEYPLMIALACFFGLDNATETMRVDWFWALGIGAATAVFIVILQTAALTPYAVAGVLCAALFATYLTHTQPARFALSITAVLLAGALHHGVHGAPVYRERSFFGIHRVTEVGGLRRLVHGNTVHGQQSLNDERKHLPLTYYSVEGPIGEVFAAYRGDARLKQVGVIGLGTGSLAAYADAGQEWTFFEIDPSVQRIAEDPKLFTFLRETRGTIHIEIGDARVQLKRSPKKFGLLVVDAFGSDAIPVHLLTSEAMSVYFDHVQTDGFIAFHISNNYVDLEPVLARYAADVDPPLTAVIRRDPGPPDRSLGIMASHWLVLARRPEDLQRLHVGGRWTPARTRTNVRVWTDDYSNLWRVFRWQSEGER